MGCNIRVLKAGHGKSPAICRRSGDGHYKGWMIMARCSTQHDGATFPAGQLIPGWVEALSLMKEGDTWELVIPSELGYGPQGGRRGYSARIRPWSST